MKGKCLEYFYFPNVFTPNVDSHNDGFKPIGQDIISYKPNIYNRWGEFFFETSEIGNGWNGYFKGLLSPINIYIWICDYSLHDEAKQIRDAVHTQSTVPKDLARA